MNSPQLSKLFPSDEIVKTVFGCLVSLLIILPVARGAPPSRVPAFGPNGSHWPDFIPTPYMYEPSANDIEVAPTWAAIKAAVQGLSDAKANAGVRILVQPGTLTGNGAGSSSTAVIDTMGNSAWTKRVTICPRDGYGTVTLSGGVRFVKCLNICFAGFKNTGGFFFAACNRSALAWTKTVYLKVVTQYAAVDKMEFSEVVVPDSSVDNVDIAQVGPDTYPATNFRFDGCYLAPRYYIAGTLPRPHTDSLQFYTTNGATWDRWNFVLRDTAIFGSNNAGLQTGVVDGINFERCYIVAGAVNLSRYPVPAGGEKGELFSAINGAGRNWTATDCYFFGSSSLSTGGGLGANQPWVSVKNSTVSFSSSSYNIPQAGSWTLNTNSSFYVAAMPPYPTDAYLTGIWKKTTVTQPPTVPGTLTVTAGGGWQNLTTSTQTSLFSVAFNMTPASIGIDAVAGLSASTAASWTDLAVAVRFSPAGVMEARNGGSYMAANVLNYQAGVTYGVLLTVNVANHTYSATVTPASGSPVVIATNYAFRTEQAAVTSLANLGAMAAVGSLSISAIAEPTTAPSPPSGLKVLPN